jgi:non-specific serine/threonine protein kinase
MLETVRRYAQDRLHDSGEESQWRSSHLACFVALGAEFNKEVMGTKQHAWIARMTSEHDNLRAALAWSIEASPLDGLQLAVALDAFWRIRGFLAEGREWYARLLDVVPIDLRTRLYARGLYAAALFAILQGDYAAGKGLLQESLMVFREIDDPRNVAYALDSLAYLAIEQGEYSEAEVRAREAVDLLRARGSREGLCFSLIHLAIALRWRGEWAAAHELYEQSLVIARELGTPWEIGTALREIGLAECDEGRCDLALNRFAEAMTILHGLGDRPGVIESLEGLAGVAAATAAPRRATRLWGAAHALQQEMGGARSAHQKIIYERQVQPVRAILTAEAFDRSWDEGRAMSLDDAVHYAMDEQAGRDP